MMTMRSWRLESYDADAPLCTDQGCWHATPHLATLRDRLDQRVSDIKALLQLCEGALSREDRAAGEQKETVLMPCVPRRQKL